MREERKRYMEFRSGGYILRGMDKASKIFTDKYG